MNSSPEDIAVAFRSLPRRIEQAHDDDTPPAAIEAARADVERAIITAATDLGAVATVEGVASAIEHRNAADWGDDELASLQHAINEAGRAIRDLEAARDAARGD